MTWNWQQSDWPNFTYDSAALASLEAQLLHKSGIQFGALQHLNLQDKQTITIDLLSNEALKT